MLDERFLEMLRCPLDPLREAKIVLDDTKVICSRCRVQFRTREGFVSFVVEEAILPEGCVGQEKLPCQREKKPAESGGR